MAGPKKEYDVIVIGGGINGLTAAAYLQKAGMSVAVFEKRDEAGTFCATEEALFPGVKVNMHASYLVPHLGPAMLDLELERFGLELLRPPGSEYNYFYPFLDGNALLFSSYDARGTYDAWKTISGKDAETYRTIANALAPLMQKELLHNELCVKHTDESFLAFLEAFEKFPLFPKDWLWMTGVEFVDCLFENEQIKVGLLSAAAMFGESLTSRISGPLCVLHAMSYFTAEGAYTARGGSHNLTHSLVRCFVHHGGKIFYNCPVEKIVIENKQAKGVVLTKLACYPEAEFRARKAVVSNLSAKPTFLQLVGEEHLSTSARVQLKRFDYRGGSLFTNYWVLNKRPEWACAKKYPQVNNTLDFNFGAETLADVCDAYDSIDVRGLPPDPPVAWGGCVSYSLADPTQAPPGHYTLMSWCFVPYELRPLGGPQKWDELRESYADKVEDVLVQYLPDLKKTKVARYANTPHDYTRKNPHSHGNMHPSGQLSEGQMWSWKPFLGCGAPKTPIDGLYISQSIHTSNFTHLGAGYQAATEVRDDLRLARPEWWKARAFDAAIELNRRIGRTQKFNVD
jgi:phytoene dehydrogenase-like protein